MEAVTLVYDVYSPDTQEQDVVVSVPPEHDAAVQLLRGALEEKLRLRVGAIAELKWHNPTTEIWEDVRDTIPSSGSRLWVRYSEGPAMLEKSRIPRGSPEHCDCEKFLESYLRPYTAASAGRAHLHKVEQLSNPQCEHQYQMRRAELFDPENVMLVTVGGPKDIVKNIARFGFDLGASKGPFGENAMVFGSNIRSVGEEGLPTPADSNKLLIAEVALGAPKVLSKPSPHLSLHTLEQQGYNSAVLPPGLPEGSSETDDTMPEHVVVYHAHQAVPRYLLTYTVDHADPEVTCPVSGEEYKLVHRKDGTLECIACAVSKVGGDSAEHYQTIDEVSRREKARFVNQQDPVSAHLRQLQGRFEEAESLHAEANAALEDSIAGITEGVKSVTDCIRHVGLQLIEELREKHRGIRERLDESVMSLQGSEAEACDIHRHLTAALSGGSDVHFQKSLARFKGAVDSMSLPPEGHLTSDPAIRASLQGIRNCSIEKDIASILRLCESLRLDSRGGTTGAGSPRFSVSCGLGSQSDLPPPPNPPHGVASVDPLEPGSLHGAASQAAVSQLSPPGAASPRDLALDAKAVLLQAGVGGAADRTSDASMPFTPRPLHPLGEQLAAESWSPPLFDADPATILTKDEAKNSRRVKGMLLAFGQNDAGQLGLGYTSPAVETPAEVSIGHHGCVALVSSGGHHTVCALTDGRLFSFGDNSRGQLGLGHRTSLSTPTPVYAFGASSPLHTSASRRGVASQGEPLEIACGADHTLVLTSSNRVFVWGRNDSGQLGMGHIDDQDSPCELTFLEGSNVLKVAAGANHSACLTDDSQLFTWGCNRDHQLGIGGITSVSFATVPQRVVLPLPQASRVTQIACGSTHSAALLDNRTHLFVWGRNDDGRLGLGHTTTTASPRLVPSVNNPDDLIQQVVATRQGTYVVTASGQVVHWGAPPLPTIPTKVGLLSSLSVKRVAGGWGHLLMLSASNHVFASGSGAQGQLGTDAACDVRELPHHIALPPKILKHRHRITNVAAAANHSFLLVAVAGSGPLGRP